MAHKPKPKGHKVLVADKISDGEGGFYPAGHILTHAEDIDGLKAKGLVE